MPKGMKIAFFNDFTGGLNLDSPRQQLALNESYDCLDVDFNLRGGFQQRRGIKVAGSSGGSPMNGGLLLGHYSLGTDMIVGVSTSKQLWTWDGATATHVATAITDQVDVPRAVAWGSKLYLANCWTAGSLVMRHRTGAALGTATTLTNTFNNTYSAPTGGNMPLARLIADHAGHMFVADTTESGTRYRSRVRWSHPLQPEDWATADYFDIEPDDSSDQITAIVPFKNQLLVFKRRAVFAIYGYDKDSFTVERLGTASGAWSAEAVSCNASICYWFSPEGNVYAYNGSGMTPVGDRITGDVRDGNILLGADHRLCWFGDRLYVSLVKSGGSSRVCYVYDPAVGRRGAWTKYSFEPTSFVWWRRADGTVGIMMTLLGKDHVFDHGIASQVQDEYTSGVSSAINGWYSTAWFSANDTALKKSWKRLHLTSATKDPCTITVDVYHDFNDSVIARTLQFTTTEPGGGSIWGTSLWGSSSWGAGDASYSFNRLPSAGRSHSVRLKFSVSDNVTTWWIDSFTLPYVEKSYR